MGESSRTIRKNKHRRERMLEDTEGLRESVNRREAPQEARNEVGGQTNKLKKTTNTLFSNAKGGFVRAKPVGFCTSYR